MSLVLPVLISNCNLEVTLPLLEIKQKQAQRLFMRHWFTQLLKLKQQIEKR